MRLCQLKATGEIYYFISEVMTSKGLAVIYEVPSSPNTIMPDIRLVYKLNFNVMFTMLTYTN